MIIADSNKGLDIMYRNPEWIEGVIKSVYDEKTAWLGYTTAFLHNIASSEVLYDRDGWFGDLKKKISAGYPQELAQAIINKNFTF